MRLAILTAAAAAAVLGAPAAADAARPASLKVRDCTVGETAKERKAVYYARMRAVPGTERMKMRFSLIDRAVDGTGPVAAPQLSKWRRSRPGVIRFGYAQTVVGLRPGGVYAVAVEFRWVDADGRRIKSARRTSRECRQDRNLPNLTVTGVRNEPGDFGTETYAIDVVNEGSTAARDFDVELFVDSVVANAEHVDELRAGEAATVHITGPACLGRIRAVIDRDDLVAETTEGDNTLRSRCPGGR